MLEKFRKLRQSIKNWIRHERKAYLREIANEAFTNPKRFWSYFKFKNKKSPIPESVTLKGVPVSEDQARAKAFNDYFKSIYKNHLCCAVPDTCPLHPDIPELIDAIQVSSAEVCELLSTLDTSKATGPDNLPVVILKNCANSLSPSLTAFINASLRSGFYVSEWKQANISPIHKKGSRQEIENYRQISLLPVVAKIQEKCVAKKLIPHINAILHPSQHGFQQGLSCTTQLLEVLQNIGLKLDKGHETDIIYLDFAKAFDSVCHRRLLWKLQHYGVSGPLLKWFENYLTGRKQRVVINGTFSSWAYVKSGVPQGSVLGPVLFLLYVNDMPRVVRSSSIAMFADDTKCFKTIMFAADTELLQSDVDSLSEWSTINELDFQPHKCENLRISRKRISFDRTYRICNIELKCISSQRDLGVLISSDLSWNKHIDTITAKANRMLGSLKRNCTKDLPPRAVKSLFIALVRSHLGYCSQVWAPQSVIRNIKLIESVQRRATKFICKTSTDLTYRDRLIFLHLLPLNYWLEYLDLVFFYKCKANHVRIDLDNYINFCSGHTRRAATGLFLKQNVIPRTSTFRDSFFQRIVNMWNVLPVEIKTAKSISSFKEKLKSVLFFRLNNIFNQDNIGTYKLICPKCRSLFFDCS